MSLMLQSVIFLCRIYCLHFCFDFVYIKFIGHIKPQTLAPSEYFLIADVPTYIFVDLTNKYKIL
jgi:hypothetical protein